MATEHIEQDLYDALNHLYDPDYRPAEALCRLLGCAPEDGSLIVQSKVIQAVEDLALSAEMPPVARVRQMYETLYNRFVLKLTQEETAERMHTSVSSVWRMQRNAIHTLARALWERAQTRSAPALEPETTDWRAQMKQELASLYASAPNTISNVGETITGALRLAGVLTAAYTVRVEVESMQPNMVTAIHPAVLRQLLVTLIYRMARYMPGGRIAIFARLEDGKVKIVLSGQMTAGERPTEEELIRDIVTPEDVSVRAHVSGERVFLWTELVSLGNITVLAVDDNADVVHFYRRATDGTHYRIIHLSDGHQLFEMIERTAPDIIVLDIMLPGVDGWELLLRLHEDPATSSIPIIVCSVVRDTELARSLGATLCLSKPVQPQEFVQALDQALAQAPAKAQKASASSAATA